MFDAQLKLYIQLYRSDGVLSTEAESDWSDPFYIGPISSRAHDFVH